MLLANRSGRISFLGRHYLIRKNGEITAVKDTMWLGLRFVSVFFEWQTFLYFDGEWPQAARSFELTHVAGVSSGCCRIADAVCECLHAFVAH